jgi:hypothetical protein
MERVIKIDANCRARVADLLHQKLELEKGEALRVVEDGYIESAELFNYRHSIGVFPNSRHFANTPAARYYDDSFMQQRGGYGVGFFERLYDETIDEAAKAAGESQKTIDHEEDLKRLDQLLDTFIKENGNKKLNELRKAMEARAAEEVQVSLLSIGNNRYRGTMRQNAPFPIEQIYDFVYVHFMDKLAKALNFLTNERRVCQSSPLAQGGFTLYGEIVTPVFPDRKDYIHVTARSEQLPENRKKYTITWRKLTDDEIQQCGETKRQPPLNHLTATITLTELPNGWTQIDIDIEFDPNLSSLSYGLGYLVSGLSDPILSKMTPIFEGAFKSIARHLARDAYYFGCLVRSYGYAYPTVTGPSAGP